MNILGGKNGTLKCSCGNLRFPGRTLCPRCYYGEDFDPVAYASAEAAAKLARETGTEPYEEKKPVYLALHFARWMVENTGKGWPLAYRIAARKYRVSVGAVRLLGAQRAANSRVKQ